MIINCLTCGKAVTTKKDVCPYCKMDITEFAIQLGAAKPEATFKDRLKGTILSFVIR